MGEHAAAIADTPGDLREGRRPVGRGRLAHQDVARLERVQVVGVVEDAGTATCLALRCRNACQCLDIAVTARCLDGGEEVLIEAEDLDEHRVGHGLGDGAEHLGHAGPALMPVVEVVVTGLDDALERVHRLLAISHRGELGPEEEEAVVGLIRTGLLGNRTCCPPHRQRHLEVDVVVVIVLPPREVGRLAGSDSGVERRLLLGGEL